MKTKLCTRIVTLALVFAMVFSIAPTTVFAGQPSSLVYNFTVRGDGAGGYTIDSVYRGSSKQDITEGLSTYRDENFSVTKGLKIEIGIKHFDGTDLKDYFDIEFVDKNGVSLAKDSSYTAKVAGAITVDAKLDGANMKVTVTMLNEEVQSAEPEPTAVDPVKDGRMDFVFSANDEVFAFDEITLNGEDVTGLFGGEEDPMWEGIEAGTKVSVGVDNDMFKVEFIDGDSNPYVTLAEGTGEAEYELPYDADVLIYASASKEDPRIRVFIWKAEEEPDPTPGTGNNTNKTAANNASTAAAVKTVAAKTADHNSLAMWIVLLCAAGGCIIATASRKRSQTV